LDISKIEAGKLVLESIDFDLKTLVSDIVDMLKIKAREKGIEIGYHYDPTLPIFVKGDPVRLAQIINNLAGNSIKFTEKGFVEVAVRAMPTQGFHFSIKDTGIGIDEGKINSIFGSFTQASSETTRKYGGTGLGLTISRKLVNLMGGDIAVESKVGFGSVFSFAINLAVGQPVLAENKLTDIEEFDAGIQILLVEDNDVNQMVAINFLQKWGLTATVANNGKEAVALIQSKKYAMILMDLQMPEMDGYEAARLIRSMDDPYFKNVPIIALTASVTGAVKSNVVEAGMTNYVSKPFSADELQSAIKRHIGYQPPIKSRAATRPSVMGIDRITEGDAKYRQELVGLLIGSLRVFKAALTTSIQAKEPEIFHRACHQVATSVSILDHEDLKKAIDEVKILLKSTNNMEVPIDKIANFNNVVEEVLQRLEDELK
jgi:CheY-like chemotaxis protein/HPt (histidine-containing phosphotransfer) domain-containing protein